METNFTGEDNSSKGEEWREVEDDLLLGGIYLNSHRLWIGHLMLKTLLLSPGLESTRVSLKFLPRKISGEVMTG